MIFQKLKKSDSFWKALKAPPESQLNQKEREKSCTVPTNQLIFTLLHKFNIYALALKEREKMMVGFGLIYEGNNHINFISVSIH